mmetsp:Transcript_54797/g.152908  ORF Transcript_54797/g.152908 Transcript_54797/m.152908 type:complete len:281 (-) Transcript_54797:1357-2199(-)
MAESSEGGKNSKTSSAFAQGSVSMSKASSTGFARLAPTPACFNACATKLSMPTETSSHHQVLFGNTSALRFFDTPSPALRRFLDPGTRSCTNCSACRRAATRQDATSFVAIGNKSSSAMSGASLIKPRISAMNARARQASSASRAASAASLPRALRVPCRARTCGCKLRAHSTNLPKRGFSSSKLSLSANCAKAAAPNASRSAPAPREQYSLQASSAETCSVLSMSRLVIFKGISSCWPPRRRKVAAAKAEPANKCCKLAAAASTLAATNSGVDAEKIHS